ncbi:hypothetical protein R5W23_000858 [Gemmata sp. JC673]|uniref:DUF4254 domain-containing protein n=1 Tax=Gemmata algarum TaxID=2975278 RepID=A0ABU5EUL1_9BACT|nr:hypothetical protein [Gemmata algarum]MDY3558137.1 hypothetical protein [Gemmata algarum]
MIPHRITDHRSWAQRYRTAVTGGHGPATASGRAALFSEVLALLCELVGSVNDVVMSPEDIERSDLLKVVAAAREALGTGPVPDPAPTVPLRELTDLARAMLEMRRVQLAYFEAKRKTPHTDHRGAYQHARRCEDRAEAMARAALGRERVALPGMEEFGG